MMSADISGIVPVGFEAARPRGDVSGDGGKPGDGCDTDARSEPSRALSPTAALVAAGVAAAVSLSR